MKLLYRFKWWQINRRRKKRLHETNRLFSNIEPPFLRQIREGDLTLHPMHQEAPPQFLQWLGCWRSFFFGNPVSSRKPDPWNND